MALIGGDILLFSRESSPLRLPAVFVSDIVNRMEPTKNDRAVADFDAKTETL